MQIFVSQNQASISWTNIFFNENLGKKYCAKFLDRDWVVKFPLRSSFSAEAVIAIRRRGSLIKAAA